MTATISASATDSFTLDNGVNVATPRAGETVFR